MDDKKLLDVTHDTEMTGVCWVMTADIQPRMSLVTKTTSWTSGTRAHRGEAGPGVTSPVTVTPSPPVLMMILPSV